MDDTSPPKKASDISNTEWFMLILALVFVDTIQWGLTILAVPSLGVTEVINEIMEFFIGPCLIFYFWVRNVKLTWPRMASMLAAWFGETIPGIDIAPFWTADAVFVWLSVRAEEGGVMGKVAGATTSVIQKKMPGGSGNSPSSTKTPPPLPKSASNLSNQPPPVPQRQNPPPLPPQPPPIDKNAYQKGADYIQGGTDYIRGERGKLKTPPNVADARQTIESNPRLVDLRNTKPQTPPNSVDLRKSKPQTNYN